MRLTVALVLFAAVGPVFAGPPSLTSDQAALRGRLDHAFLEAGINMTVEVIGDPKGILVSHGQVPVLVFWTQFLSRPDVYQIQTKLDVIGEARKANFKSVVFYGAAGTGTLYRFDVSKPGQVCARDLCF